MAYRMSITLLASAACLTACATAQENPHYQHSTTYKGDTPYVAQAATTQQAAQYATYVQPATPVSYQRVVQAAPVSAPQTAPVSYQRVVESTTQPYSVTPTAYNGVATTHQPYASASTTATSGSTYTRLDHRCLRKEMNRQLIGGAVGGTAGAVLGKQTIGGTKGTVAGAALGGALGYGAGDKSINCDPVTVQIQEQSAYVSPAYAPNTGGLAQPVYANAHTTAPTVTARQITPSAGAAMPDSYGTPGYQAMMQNNQTVPQTAAPVMAAAAMPQNGYGTFVSLQPSSYHEVRKGDTVYSLSRNLCTTIDDIRSINGLDQNFSIRLGDTLKLPGSKC